MGEFRKASRIEEFRIGRVVQFSNGRHGHVDGFALNRENETIVVVKIPEKTNVENGKHSYSYLAIHPSNLIPLGE